MRRAHAIWAADLCVVQTLTFKTLDVLLFIAHGRRELVHLAVTAHPTAAWVWRRLVDEYRLAIHPLVLARGGGCSPPAARPARRGGGSGRVTCVGAPRQGVC